jgi:uncharacterized protein involved in exopolysaccharide biosynthesis
LAWLVPLVAVLGAVVGAATGAFASTRYRSETELVVGPGGTVPAPGSAAAKLTPTSVVGGFAFALV